jgi:predicted dithiol-disulfide oxidoreductase (DUF899 family)
MAKKAMRKATKKKTAKASTSSSSSIHAIRFPGESTAYRTARNALLKDEIALRAQIEAVAAKRRTLPLGGAIPEDYVFDELAADGSVAQVRLSDLFQPGKDTLIVYSYMFGPKMAAPCVACTSILDGLDGESEHVNQRVNFVVVAKSPIERIDTLAHERGWSGLRLLSSANNDYNRQYQGEDAKGNQLPSLNVFVKRNGRIHHF